MFDAPFSFRTINHQQKINEGHKFIEHSFSFNGRNGKRYIVTAEQYEYHVYVIKFCLQARKIHSDRFNTLTGFGECSRILATIGAIIKNLYRSNPFASFGFVGANSPGEAKEDTKRFKLYKRVISNFVSPVIFEHHYVLNHSAYIILNRENTEPDLLNKITQMFTTLFNF